MATVKPPGSGGAATILPGDLKWVPMPAPPLNPRSLLFTLYGDYVRPLGQDGVRVGALVRLAAELGVGDNALRSALSRITREGWLLARRNGGAPPDGLSAR